MKITAHFSLKEFRCKDGTDVPEELLGNLRLLCMCLERIRKEYGKPIKVISGYRTLEYNRKINSKDTSKHVQALAADIVIEDVLPPQIAIKIQELEAVGELPSGCGLGVYGRFTHFDPRPDRARWSG